MTLLEAPGPAAEVGRPAARITASNSALQRTVEGVPVADSFAWARVNSRGEVAQEAVYWPSLPANILTEVRQFRELLADPQRLQSFKSRLPVSVGEGAVAIRQSSATVDQGFESFASFDVSLHSSQASSQKAPAPGTSVTITRHFDINGTERFLPQETLNLGAKYPATKQPATKTSAGK
jgi:hypothetical protein